MRKKHVAPATLKSAAIPRTEGSKSHAICIFIIFMSVARQTQIHRKHVQFALRYCDANCTNIGWIKNLPQQVPSEVERTRPEKKSKYLQIPTLSKKLLPCHMPKF